MFKVQTLNNISSKGLSRFPHESYSLAEDIADPQAIILRSYNLHDRPIPDSVLAIARAGAGVNNIPVTDCTKRGIIVFNTPGANANSVKELVIAALLLSARGIHPGLSWTGTLGGKGNEVAKLVEKEKARFAGTEILGKKLGVVGLGAIGAMVANAAIGMGMEVIGFDPFISVENAWGLSRSVRRARSLDALFAEADYITLHVPLTDDTKNTINRSRIASMKKGVRIMNFARGGLVANDDIIAAVDSGQVAGYVTDFPEDVLLGRPGILCVPHLGASTEEAEDNCAVMAVEQLKAFLETGNIRNSVNFPDCQMDLNHRTRLLVANRNIPNLVGQITTVLANGG
ncbi:MAG TPA: 3-phosphoglycerate dehydrogenase, partial [Spirochaetia bacterium]|nr:3-phosphoglycerate dehydrogenase [Spirochaetia bacterium]